MKVVATYVEPHLAHLACGWLEAAGIPAIVTDEHIVAANPFMSNAVGNVKVQVADEDFDRAHTVLNLHGSDSSGRDNDAFVEGDPEVNPLHGVVIHDTKVIGWQSDAEKLAFFLEASLSPEHPQYDKPKPGEEACYKPAVLVFWEPTEISGLPEMRNVEPFNDPDGTVHYGTIESIDRPHPGLVQVWWEFGVVEVLGAKLELLVADRA